MFNCPYDNNYFEGYAEDDFGQTITMIQSLAKKYSCIIIAGSIPEKYENKIQTLFENKDEEIEFKKEEIWQVKRDMFDSKDWLEVKTKKKDLKCTSCKKDYTKNSKIGVMSFKSNLNKRHVHLCDECGIEYIKIGAIDINKKHAKVKNEKNALKEKIINNYKKMDKSEHFFRELEKTFEQYNEVEQYKRKLESSEKALEKYERINSVDTDSWTELEPYLKEQYGVIEDREYMRSVEEIEDNFSNTYRNYFDCGQGIYQDEAEVLVKIADKFYKVTLSAEVLGAKQNIGEKLYHVESLKNIDFEEIEKPKKKPETKFNLEVEMLVEDKEKLEKFLSEKNIKFKIKER
jgi:DNA repair ATPase RecN